MIIKPPETIEEFDKVLQSILEMQGNSYCDHKMFMDLLDREVEVRNKIKELKLK
tara:strand:- start:761 stop:922 length:162 start_codon:yes stop_codon:yes gene_type:complete